MTRGRSPNPLDPLEGTPSDTLDLHGFTRVEAVAHVERYLAQHRKQSPGALLHIITGKGRNSPDGPVLRTAVRSLLRADGGRLIADWARDHDDGGFLIRLKGGAW